MKVSTALKSLMVAGFLFAMVVACAPTSPELVKAPPPPAPPMPTPKPYAGPEKVQASQAFDQEIKLAPKVDILFVIDTSESMKKHIDRLHSSVDQFVSAFKRRHDIDFHIGVATVWDDEERFTSRALWPMGKLRPLKDLARPQYQFSGDQYVKREGDWTKVLAGTLKVDYQPRYTRDARGRITGDGGGPEVENLFSPTLEAITGFAKNENKEPILGQDSLPLALNGNFVRPDAHLAVIFVTDADDSSSLNPAALDDILRRTKGNGAGKVSAYGVLALDCGTVVDPGLKEIDPRTGRFVKDPKTGKDRVRKPLKILEFIDRSEGLAMNLCEKNGYGRKLAEIGKTIETKATRLVTVQLDLPPQPSTIVVTYNGVPLSFGSSGAWSYNSETNEIQIRANHPEIADSPGGKINVRYMAVDMELVKAGHIEQK